MDKGKHRFFKNPSGYYNLDEQALLEAISNQLSEKHQKCQKELQVKLDEKENLKNQEGHQFSLADIDYEVVRLKLDISQTEKRIEIIGKMRNHDLISETDWKLVKNYETNNKKLEINDYKYVKSSDDSDEITKPASQP